MRRGEGSSSSNTRDFSKYYFTFGSQSVRRIPPPPRLPLFMIRSGVNENDATMMFEKTLGFWDVNYWSNALSLRSDMVLWALKQEERSILARDGFLEVPTVDPSGNGYNMRLQHRPSNRTVVLRDEWKELVKTNGLKIGDMVQGWALRGEDGGLRCFLTLMHRLN